MQAIVRKLLAYGSVPPQYTQKHVKTVSLFAIQIYSLPLVVEIREKFIFTTGGDCDKQSIYGQPTTK